jgi:outer membrane protein TolC
LVFMVHLILTLVLPIIFTSGKAIAALKDWPPEAASYVNALPEHQLTLEQVVGQAVAQADIFQAHKSEAMRAESVELQTTSAEDTTLKSSYNFFDLKTDPLNPNFQTIRTSGWEARVGAQKYFSSGTNLSVEGVHGPQKLQYRTNPTIDVFASSLNIGLTQSLWSDAFGKGYRSLRRAAESDRLSIESGMMRQIEASALDVINLFYQAWLKQQVAQNLLEGKERKDTLVRILRGQERRHVVETTELLQVEGLTLSTEAEYLNTKRDLQGSWEQLVINLKLPRSFMNVNAAEIPLVLDAPEEKSAKLCQRLTFADLQKNSYQLKEADAATIAASERVKALESKLNPDLSLKANYMANGVDSSARETLRNIQGRDFPAINAGIYLTVPLQNRAARAIYLAAKANYEQLRYRKSILANDLEVQWTVLCQTLAQKRVTRDKYQQVNQKNKQRVNLQNRRFKMGRIRAMEWTQAEEDEAANYLKFQQAEVEVRLVAWEVQRQTGALSDFLRPLMK